MLQSPLASAFRVAFNFRFTMPGDLFPNIDRVKGVKCPMFIIHGTRCGWVGCLLAAFAVSWAVFLFCFFRCVFGFVGCVMRLGGPKSADNVKMRRACVGVCFSCRWRPGL